MKIDTSDWKEFHLYDMPETIEISMGNKLNKSNMHQTNPQVNFVGRSGVNNGVTAFVDLTNDKNENLIQPYKAGDITIALGGSIGSCFIQTKDFYTSQNVAVLHFKVNVSYYAKMFLVSCIYAGCTNYEAFMDELNKHIKTDFTIKLPTTSQGTPNWDYMERYMKHVETQTRNALSQLKRACAYQEPAIDTNDWGEFKVEELFEKPKLKFHHGGRPSKITDISTIRDNENNLPLVSAKNDNNGIMYYGRKEDFDYINMALDIVQNGASAVGNVYPQIENTGLLEDAYLITLINKPKISKETLIFLAAVIQKMIKQYFSYDNKCTWKRVKIMSIKLPVTATGQPDWNYMNRYMQHIKTRSVQVVQKLKYL